MEIMVMDGAFWRNKRVFITGHTGFKGAWAVLLLRLMGARVSGLALAPSYSDNLFELAAIEKDISHRVGDIRDLDLVRAAMQEADPQIVLHMAAQSLVRPSYANPAETYAVNVMGTVHILEAARTLQNLAAVLVVTSDKCYENTGRREGYRETDPMGGYDPYSSSKGAAELVTAAYRQSFFTEGAARIASVRAGNVIGGGDWATDRLVPDIMRAFIAGKTPSIRNPNSTRPWQHVLDPVMGYLTLAERMCGKDGASFAEGWNFGPDADGEATVAALADTLAAKWGDGARWARTPDATLHEAVILGLDCSKARERLDWHPAMSLDRALDLTVAWYRAFAKGQDMRAVTLDQIANIVDPPRRNAVAS